jgi:hypothetical protein
VAQTARSQIALAATNILHAMLPTLAPSQIVHLEAVKSRLVLLHQLARIKTFARTSARTHRVETIVLSRIAQYAPPTQLVVLHKFVLKGPARPEDARQLHAHPHQTVAILGPALKTVLTCLAEGIAQSQTAPLAPNIPVVTQLRSAHSRIVQQVDVGPVSAHPLLPVKIKTYARQAA